MPLESHPSECKLPNEAVAYVGASSPGKAGELDALVLNTP